jgi:KUP system potassium uptake protein
VIAHSDVPLPPRGAPSSPTGGVARYGPRRAADTLRLLDPAQIEGLIAIDYVSYVLSEIELTMGESPTMAPWRKRLFIATSHLTADAVDFFRLPRDRTVIVGSRIEV